MGAGMEGEPAAGAAYLQSRQHPGAAAGSFRRLDGLAKVAVAFLVANVVIDLAAVVTDVQMVGLANRAKAGELVTFEEADALDIRMARLGLLQVAAILIAAIPFLLWFRRAYRNLGALGIRTLRFKPGWAVGGWFVPFLGLARPKSIANDIWRATDPTLPPDVDKPPEGGHVSPLLNLWWAAYVLTGFLYGSGNELDRRPSIDEVLSQAERYAVADAVSVLAGVLAILVVRRMTDRMHRRAAAVSTGATPEPAAVSVSSEEGSSATSTSRTDPA